MFYLKNFLIAKQLGTREKHINKENNQKKMDTVNNIMKNSIVLDTSFIVFLAEFRLDFIALIKSEFPNYNIFLTIESIEEIVNLYENKKLTLPKTMFIFSILLKRNPKCIISEKDLNLIIEKNPNLKINSNGIKDIGYLVSFNDIFNLIQFNIKETITDYLITKNHIEKLIEKIKEYSSEKNHYLDYNDLKIINYFRKLKKLFSENSGIKDPSNYMSYNRLFFVATGDIKLKKLLKREGISLIMFNPKKKRIISL